MEMTQNSLKWIIDALQESKVAKGSRTPPPVTDWEQERLEERRRQEERIREEKAQVQDMLLRGINTHIRSRTSPYLGSSVARFPVPDHLVSWKVDYPEYSPSVYTAKVVLDKPLWADPDIFNLTPSQRGSRISNFNAIDMAYNVNRKSFLGPYEVLNGIPLNPMGRTGLQGRGLLGRWGPNQAGDPIVTRWKMQNGCPVLIEGKPVLEFVAVLRSDNQMWALPGAMLPPGSTPTDNLEADFTEEALGALEGAKDEKSLRKKLKKLWKKGVKIYEGYADDPRNTDNAWIETTAVYYHDDKGDIIDKFNLKAGETVELASWLTLSHKVTMHGSHLYLLKLTADSLGAYF